MRTITLPTKKEAQQWADALRSGKYKQTKGKLQDSNGYCCLGVACEVFIPEEKRPIKPGRYLEGGTPTAQSFAPDWLKDINSDLQKRTDDEVSFISLNDSSDKNYTFDMIADIVELVYVHGALDEVTE